MSIDLLAKLDDEIAETTELLEHYNDLKTKIKRKQVTLATKWYYHWNICQMSIHVYYCRRGEACSSIYSHYIKIEYEDAQAEFNNFVEELKSIYPKVKIIE